MGLDFAQYDEAQRRRFRWGLAARMLTPLSTLDHVLDPERTDHEAIERDWERELAHQGRNAGAIDDALVELGLPPGGQYGTALRHVHERRPRRSDMPRWRRVVKESRRAEGFRRWLVVATSRTVADWERRGMPREKVRAAQVLSVALHEQLQRARLSERERLVMTAWLGGEWLADIARREGLHPSTVGEYLHRGKRKLAM